ncbi:MAG TPA: hypothetical protein VM430_13510 [Microbacterium sp.]|nr:hypothetical protein [Microbacterium sp.]
MPKVEVEYIERAYEPALGTDTFRIAKVVTDDDGRTHRLLRVEPTFSVAARMAEYGCSQEQAVRLVLAEPHMPDRPEVPQIFADPVWRRGAADHLGRVEQVATELGFDPLDLRTVPDGDDVEHPARVMAELDVPDELVAELRMRHAEQRAAFREATADAASRESERRQRLSLGTPAPRADGPADQAG